MKKIYTEKKNFKINNHNNNNKMVKWIILKHSLYKKSINESYFKYSKNYIRIVQCSLVLSGK